MMEIEKKIDHCQFTGIELILAHFGICRSYVVSEFTWRAENIFHMGWVPGPEVQQALYILLLLQIYF